MIDEFYATLKLNTSDEILGYVEIHDEGVIITNPLVLEDMSIFEDVIDNIQSKGFKLSKWVKSSTDEIFFIRHENIVTIGELIEPGLTYYKKALMQIQNTEKGTFNKNKNVPHKKKYEGHRGSIKEARTKFEKLFKDY
jgi:hypothetical protein